MTTKLGTYSWRPAKDSEYLLEIRDDMDFLFCTTAGEDNAKKICRALNAYEEPVRRSRRDTGNME